MLSKSGTGGINNLVDLSRAVSSERFSQKLYGEDML